jgi:hypothetical protein
MLSVNACVAVLACVSFGPCAAKAGDVPMVTLTQFLKGVQINSPHTVQFVSMRCAALYLTFVSAIPETDVSRDEIRKGLSAKAVWFMVRAQGVQEKVAPNSAEVKDGFVVGNIRKMQELYAQRAVDARAATGHFSSDPLLQSDTQTCAAIISPS